MAQLGCSMRRTAVAAIAIWVLILVYLSIGIFTIQSRETAERMNENLFEKYGRAMKDVGLLREQNEELKRMLIEKETLKENDIKHQRKKFAFGEGIRSVMATGIDGMKAPGDLFSKEHEIARRDLHNSIKELFFYLSSQFEENGDLPFATHAINQMLSLLGQSAAFSDVDGAGRWREVALAGISGKIQSQLDRLQNPEDCASARALICQLNKGCGFGCQLHHVTYCFIVAYCTNRTLILQRDGREWNYAEDGWTAAFRPVSRCNHSDVSKNENNEEEWSSMELSAAIRVVRLPIIDGLHGRPPFLPLAFPEWLAPDLLKLHSNPPVFFVSQFMRYLMRPNDIVANKIADAASKIPFDDGPLVGLQIRRTDKVGTEAAFHELAEYMKWTEYWFQIQEYRTGKAIRRRIYVATDDPSVFPEAKEKYPNYEVYGDAAIANSAQTRRRYRSDSLFGVIIDIEMLARCTYLVCTFSSQVCRMGYELMQIRVGDAGNKFHSLDDLYYYGGQQAHEQVVVEAYKAESRGEISIEVGDVIGVAGNHWDGFSKGVNRRTGMVGLYPSYKVREKWIIVPFP